MGKGGDGSRAQSAAVVEPEDAPATGKFGRRNSPPETAVNFLHQNAVFDLRGTPSKRFLYVNLTTLFFLFKTCKNIAAASFPAMGSLEVANAHICLHNLQKPK